MNERSNVMIRFPVVSSVSVIACLVLATACAHDGDRAGATTVTSGSTEGVRVTNVTVGDYDPADRLAGELCQREATCGRTQGARSDEAKLLGEQNCVTMNAPRMRGSIDGWGCNAMTHRAHFEECLAAIRSAACETSLEQPDILPACRGNAVCAD